MFYASYRRRIPICLSGGEHISRLVETLALVGALAYIRKFFYKRKIFFELKCYKKRQLYKIYEPLYCCFLGIGWNLIKNSTGI